MTPHTHLAQDFDDQRERLVAVAYRMLGSRPDAEDAVQETWLRLARQDADAIENLPGWLTTVVGRVCIDMLRARRTDASPPYDEHLPDLVVSEDSASAPPEESAVLAESVGLALLVVLESLGPDERLAFVLHDMFAVPFAEIGEIIGRSTDATKMLASRARRKVQGSARPTDSRQRQRDVVDAFLAAARDGDFEGLLRVLDPDLTWRVHTPRGVTVKLGATEVVSAVERGRRSTVIARRVLVNGEPGILAWGPNGRPIGLMACTVVDGRIAEITSVLDPRRLAAMDLPAPPRDA